MLAWDAFRVPVFADDEALRLGRAVGINPDREVTGRLAKKRGSNLVLWDSARRAAKGELGPADGSESPIDALHHTAHVARMKSLAAVRELAKAAHADRYPRFFAALEAVLEVLPAGAVTGVALQGDAAAAGSDFERCATSPASHGASGSTSRTSSGSGGTTVSHHRERRAMLKRIGDGRLRDHGTLPLVLPIGLRTGAPVLVVPVC